MEYFNEYKNAKICLYMIIGQFLNVNLPSSEAGKYGVSYIYGEKVLDTIDVCYHDFKSEGLLAWNYLGIDEPFIKLNEIWERRRKIKDEVIDENIDYYQMYLKMSILLIDMVIKYYKFSISSEEAEFNNVECDLDVDEISNEVDVCHHYYESAGETVWNFFNIESPIVGQSVFLNKRKVLCDELLKLKQEDVKKLVK